MGNNQNSNFMADVISVVVGIALLLSYFTLPFTTIPDTLTGTSGLNISLTLLNWLSGTQMISAFDQGSSLMMIIISLIILATLAAVIAGAIGLGSHQYSRTTSYVILAAGSFILLAHLGLIFQISSLMGPLGGTMGETLSYLGLGCWLNILLALVLIGQVFITRNPAAGFSSFPASSPPPMIGSDPGPTQLPPSPQLPRPSPQTQAATRIASPPPPSAQRANAWLVNIQTQQSHQLSRGETRIGRSRARNQIILTSDRVSRDHALIREEGQHFILYSVGAKQPIYVNGQPISHSYVLSPEDQLTLGDVTLRFVRA